VVPHRNVLRAIALVSFNAPELAEKLCSLHHVKFPCTLEQFWQAEMAPWLTPEMQAIFLTTDQKATGDYRPLFIAAKQLGVSPFIMIGEDGPTVKVSDDVLKWRQHETIRVAMEIMLLCNMAASDISEDFKRMYQLPFDASDIDAFASLYVNREFATGQHWLVYVECIPTLEAQMKLRLMRQPRDYVRWQLGVPVQLETEQVLNRLISDGYFTCMQMKSDTGNEPSKEQLARIKLERDTIFKSMDRLAKFREVTGGSQVSDAVAAIREIAKHVELQDQHFPTISDIIADEK
jgi:hypothetical protein